MAIIIIIIHANLKMPVKIANKLKASEAVKPVLRGLPAVRART